VSNNVADTAIAIIERVRLSCIMTYKAVYVKQTQRRRGLEKFGETGSCNFPTNTCKFPTAKASKTADVTWR